MRLAILLEGMLTNSIQIDYDVRCLALDSRHIKTNDLFIAIQGTQLDGRAYIADAISRGAAAVLIEANNSSESIRWQEQVPCIPIVQLKNKIGLLAARFYGYPAKKLRMVGITGTNGKTSCAHFIAQSLQSLQNPCGMIGTLGNGFYGSLHQVGLTTPDAITVQKILHEFLLHKGKAVAMEVSSHSIDQGRVNDIDFEMAIFTNLSQDHLDYHGTMETYAAVKRKFLAKLSNKYLIINADDSYGQKWIHELAGQKPIFAYSTQHSCLHASNVELIYADHIAMSFQGIHAFVHTPWGEAKLFLPLVGRFNLSNALAALTALCLYGIPFKEVIEQLSKLNSVPGRMQFLGAKGKPFVVIDYSHTPDALEKALEALRAHTVGKLVCVFGCGGNRDHTKRPIMAKIAEQLADQVIVTSDNPRYEKPEAIAAEIMQGFTHPERVWVELDRSKAIDNSIQWAKANDCVLIAGKGAERYQQIGDEKLPFDDADIAGRCLELN